MRTGNHSGIFDIEKPEIVEELESTKVLSDELKKKIVKAAQRFQKNWHNSEK